MQRREERKGVTRETMSGNHHGIARSVAVAVGKILTEMGQVLDVSWGRRLMTSEREMAMTTPCIWQARG